MTVRRCAVGERGKTSLALRPHVERRVLIVGIVFLALGGAALWLVPGSPMHGAALAGATNQEVGAAFLGLLLIVGVALGFDMRDWFER